MLRRTRRLAFENLESRRLLAADSILIEQSVLGVRGTNGDDVIDVRRVAAGPQAGDLQVSLNDDVRIFTYKLDWWTNDWSIEALVILGRGGDDQINIAPDVFSPAYVDGGKGNDTITTAGRDDVILGGSGDDTIFAGAGHDAIDGGSGHDIILGGSGDDLALGGKGDDAIYGEDGFDALAGDAGRDALYGQLGEDALSGGKGNDLLDGGADSDLLMDDAGIDHCYGGDGDDLFDGGSGNDFLFGEAGDDLIAAGKGNDELRGGEGSDGLFGDAGQDSLFGDDDNDHLDGGIGADLCLGGDGNDQIKGGSGMDHVDGQAGDNLFDSDGETGKDLLANATEADLDDEMTTTMNGTIFANYGVENRGGTIVHTLTVELVNYQGFFSYVDILIDGVLAGSIDTQGTGNGLLVLSTHPTGNELPFPAGFPEIWLGSQFQVRSGQMMPNQWVFNSSSNFSPAYVT